MACEAACSVFGEVNLRLRGWDPKMTLSYAFDSEYSTCPEKKGSYHTLPQTRREEIELVPQNKEANGPYLLYVQITAPECTTAIFDLRKLCETVGHGDKRRSLLPKCLRTLLTDPGIIFSLCGGDNDRAGMKSMFGLGFVKNRPGNGRDCFVYMELQEWSWNLGYKLFSKATETQNPQPMKAALWRLVALGLGFDWKENDANDTAEDSPNGPNFLLDNKNWFKRIPGNRKGEVFLRGLTEQSKYYMAQDPAYTMYATYILMFSSPRKKTCAELRDFRDAWWTDLQVPMIGSEYAEGQLPSQYFWMAKHGKDLVSENFVEDYKRRKGEGKGGVAIYYESKLAFLSVFQTVANRLAHEHSHHSPLVRMQGLRRFLSWLGKRWRLKFKPGSILNRNPSRDRLCSEDGRR
ncbi:MAG: hypothetical protein GY696_20120 [Gammaproteobacteria bacterium]|nr:hypothetical protein [Gammaproteobacteria bacterium]